MSMLSQEPPEVPDGCIAVRYAQGSTYYQAGLLVVPLKLVLELSLDGPKDLNKVLGILVPFNSELGSVRSALTLSLEVRDYFLVDGDERVRLGPTLAKAIAIAVHRQSVGA